MRSELKLLEKFIQHCHAKQEGQSDTYITQIYSNMQELLLVQFLNQELQHQQSKVDELQYKAKLRESDHQALLVKYQATKKCWEDMSKEKDELQKRVDAVKALIEEYRDPPTEDKTFQHALSIVAYELEQALKGGGE